MRWIVSFVYLFDIIYYIISICLRFPFCNPFYHRMVALSKMKVDDLRAELATRQLDTTGKKSELQSRLREARAVAGAPDVARNEEGDDEDVRVSGPNGKFIRAYMALKNVSYLDALKDFRVDQETLKGYIRNFRKVVTFWATKADFNLSEDTTLIESVKTMVAGKVRIPHRMLDVIVHVDVFYYLVSPRIVRDLRT